MKQCSIPNCGKPMRARSYCAMHWSRWRHYGDPNVPLHNGALPKKIQYKFRESGCLEITSHKGRNGYPGRIINGQWVDFHRSALQVVLGRSIRPGLYACHTCDNKQCVSPDHLYEGTPQDNVRDKVQRGRQYRGVSCWTAKLTEEDVRTIKTRLSEGEIGSTLAKAYNVTQATISRIKYNRSWAWLSYG